MKAYVKNTSMWRTTLIAVGASALIAGCTTEEAVDEGDLSEGTYAVTGFDLGSCADSTWKQSTTTTSQLVVEANGDGYTVKTCAQVSGAMSCTPSAPSIYQWSTDAWRGSDGGAYLVESGCSLIYVDAMARMADNQLVIEASRWSATLAGGSCTYDEVMAMRQNACDYRIRLSATAL
jgi:hypothetical protein